MMNRVTQSDLHNLALTWEADLSKHKLGPFSKGVRHFDME